MKEEVPGEAIEFVRSELGSGRSVDASSGAFINENFVKRGVEAIHLFLNNFALYLPSNLVWGFTIPIMAETAKYLFNIKT